MEVKVKKQRLDSTHVLSDMSNIGRARMIGLALKRFFAKLAKHDASLLKSFDQDPEALPEAIRQPSVRGTHFRFASGSANGRRPAGVITSLQKVAIGLNTPAKIDFQPAV